MYLRLFNCVCVNGCIGMHMLVCYGGGEREYVFVFVYDVCVYEWKWESWQRKQRKTTWHVDYLWKLQCQISLQMALYWQIEWELKIQKSYQITYRDNNFYNDFCQQLKTLYK